MVEEVSIVCWSGRWRKCWDWLQPEPVEQMYTGTRMSYGFVKRGVSFWFINIDVDCGTTGLTQVRLTNYFAFVLRFAYVFADA